jgi:hypothetical protein
MRASAAAKIYSIAYIHDCLLALDEHPNQAAFVLPVYTSRRVAIPPGDIRAGSSHKRKAPQVAGKLLGDELLVQDMRVGRVDHQSRHRDIVRGEFNLNLSVSYSPPRRSLDCVAFAECSDSQSQSTCRSIGALAVCNDIRLDASRSASVANYRD